MVKLPAPAMATVFEEEAVTKPAVASAARIVVGNNGKAPRQSRSEKMGRAKARDGWGKEDAVGSRTRVRSGSVWLGAGSLDRVGFARSGRVRPQCTAWASVEPTCT